MIFNYEYKVEKFTEDYDYINQCSESITAYLEKYIKLGWEPLSISAMRATSPAYYNDPNSYDTDYVILMRRQILCSNE